MDKVLVFDIWGEYAHFKKYYTTTSPLTFSIPPKTTIYGMIGAILGLKKDEYLDYFQKGKCKVGIQIKNPIKKTRINLNLIDTKKAKLMSRIDTRTQIKTEFLKDVKYRIYFYHNDNMIYNRLKGYLENHKTVYSLSLGLSENLADFKFIGEHDIDKVIDNDKWVELTTALRLDDDNLAKGDIDFSQSKREYFSDKIAAEMESDRQVIDYAKVVFERQGKSIKARPDTYYQLETGENCFLF